MNRKRIYIGEEALKAIKKENVLPDFLFKFLKNHTTSLGDNEAFPSGDDFDFDYTIIKERFDEVVDAIDELGLPSLDEDYLVSELSSLLKECSEREKPMRDTLERMCENLINSLFPIPSDMVNMTFKLTDKITYNITPRIKPEPTKIIGHKFKNSDDILNSKKTVAKRRFINSLIQGASYTYMMQLLDDEELNNICNDLIPLYKKLIAINDYLLFIKKEKITDEKPMQGAYSEVYLGSNGNRSAIDTQGLIFPLLLQESIRGLFELLSSHGLPKDINKAKYLIKRADFILAEPWDMRFGVSLWNTMFGEIEDTNIIPYLFVEYVKLPVEDFNKTSKEILASTEQGDEILSNMISDAEYEYEYQGFTNRINVKNMSKALVNDGYFSAAELSSLDLDNDEGESSDVIEEDDV